MPFLVASFVKSETIMSHNEDSELLILLAFSNNVHRQQKRKEQWRPGKGCPPACLVFRSGLLCGACMLLRVQARALWIVTDWTYFIMSADGYCREQEQLIIDAQIHFCYFPGWLVTNDKLSCLRGGSSILIDWVDDCCGGWYE